MAANPTIDRIISLKFEKEIETILINNCLDPKVVALCSIREDDLARERLLDFSQNYMDIVDRNNRLAASTKLEDIDVANLISKSLSLNKLLENPNLFEPRYFIPPTGHPFYDSIVKARVPLSESKKPDLLLYNLPLLVSEQEILQLESENVFIDDDPNNMEVEETLREPTKHLLKLLGEFNRSQASRNCAVLLGVSGCSKTRTALEVLSRSFGLYFTASAVGNVGSWDLERLLQALEKELANISDQHEREALGTHYVNAILYARLLVLQRFLSSNNPNPYHWLLLQLKRSLLEGPTSDFFHTLTTEIIKSNPKYLETNLQKLIGDFRRKFGYNLVIVVDEAHTLIDRCQYFHGPTQTSVRGLLTKMITTYTYFPEVSLVVAGTGLRLQQALQVVASAVAKLEADFWQYLVVNFGGYHELDAMKGYLTQFFPIDDDQMREAFELLQGRYRFTAFFAQQVMTKAHFTSGHTLISDVFESVITWATGKGALSPALVLWDLYELRKHNMLQGESPFQLYRDLVVSYYLFDKKQVFLNPNVLSMVETGICPLHRSSSGQLIAYISEPLTAWAVRSFFETINQPIETAILEYMGKYSLTPSTHGIFFEYYLIPAIIKFFTTVPTIDQHPYFKTYHGLPNWVQGAKLILSNKDAPVIKKAKPNLDLNSFIANPDMCDVFVPENEARHDAVMRVRAADGTEHLMIMQWKLRKTLSAQDVREAVFTTDPQSAYTTVLMHNTNPKKRKQKEQLNVVEQQKFPRESGTMRVLVCYPHTINDKQFKGIELKVEHDTLVILDRQRSAELFSSTAIWKFLDHLQILAADN